ncbi:RNA-guided endonuclease InsQ/TnpB family protein [Clostridium pasteurianum]|uniref:Transposase, IS605 OrfB family, central region n=1 Tax=Clostridium pasteurianum BC1 TaxID=86416 RepID=R4JZC6_CLOPA|nr:RNA-guided endonuclease TnpB family protein [Clostridium pasteurianum]AGK95658.1 transposase, IS605 OrfB family, central region [Clostridium pasteurianum BC1]
MSIKRNKGYKYRLKPTKEEREYFEKAFGCTRKLYNIYVDMLYEKLENKNYVNGKVDYRTVKFPTPAAIKKEYEYMKEIDSLAFANVQLDFQEALKKYNKEYDGKTYRKKSKKLEKTTGKILTFRDIKGMPSFKSKRQNHHSFTTNNQKGTISIVDECYVKIPKLKSLIKFVKHREIPEGYCIKAASVSKDCRGKYYISFTVEYYEEEKEITPENFIGLDYSQTSFYVSSEDEKANYPHYYRENEEKLKKEYRKLTRKKLKSKNWCKQKSKISRLQEKISNQRKDWLHKKSFELSQKYDAVCIEDINLRNIAQCLSLGKNVQDNGFGMFRNFLEYKLQHRGKHLIKIDKWYPSSKTCSSCGSINDKLQLSERVWTCKNCNIIHDRDKNASVNIRNEGIRIYEKSKSA